MKVTHHNPPKKVKANFWDDDCAAYREFEYEIVFEDWTSDPQMTYDIRDFLTENFGNSITSSINPYWDIHYTPRDNKLRFYIQTEEILTQVLIRC